MIHTIGLIFLLEVLEVYFLLAEATAAIQVLTSRYVQIYWLRGFLCILIRLVESSLGFGSQLLNSQSRGARSLAFRTNTIPAIV